MLLSFSMLLSLAMLLSLLLLLSFAMLLSLLLLLSPAMLLCLLLPLSLCYFVTALVSMLLCLLLHLSLCYCVCYCPCRYVTVSVTTPVSMLLCTALVSMLLPSLIFLQSAGNIIGKGGDKIKLLRSNHPGVSYVFSFHFFSVDKLLYVLRVRVARQKRNIFSA